MTNEGREQAAKEWNEQEFNTFMEEKRANRKRAEVQRRAEMERPKVYENRQSADGVSSFDVWPTAEGNTVS